MNSSNKFQSSQPCDPWPRELERTRLPLPLRRDRGCQKQRILLGRGIISRAAPRDTKAAALVEPLRSQIGRADFEKRVFSLKAGSPGERLLKQQAPDSFLANIGPHRKVQNLKVVCHAAGNKKSDDDASFVSHPASHFAIGGALVVLQCPWRNLRAPILNLQNLVRIPGFDTPYLQMGGEPFKCSSASVRRR